MFTRIAAGVFASACLVLAPAYAEDINYALHNETSYVVTEFTPRPPMTMSGAATCSATASWAPARAPA